MLSQRLMLTPTTDTVATATVVDTMVVTDIEDTTATGKGLLSLLLWLNQLLMPSQRLPQIPTTVTDIVVATTATVDTVEDTGAELNRLLTLCLNFTLATISSNSNFTCTAESQ